MLHYRKGGVFFVVAPIHQLRAGSISGFVCALLQVIPATGHHLDNKNLFVRSSGALV